MSRTIPSAGICTSSSSVTFSMENRERAHDYERPFRTVIIHNDLHPFFPNAEAVNRALRAAAELVHQVEARRAS